MANGITKKGIEWREVSMPDLDQFIAGATSNPELASAIVALNDLDDDDDVAQRRRDTADWALLMNQIVGQETV